MSIFNKHNQIKIKILKFCPSEEGNIDSVKNFNFQISTTIEKNIFYNNNTLRIK